MASFVIETHASLSCERTRQPAIPSSMVCAHTTQRGRRIPIKTHTLAGASTTRSIASKSRSLARRRRLSSVLSRSGRLKCSTPARFSGVIRSAMNESNLPGAGKNSEAQLRRLANAGTPAERESVARNPSTPIDAVVGLVKTFPEAVLQNPVFSRLLLTDPALVARVSNAGLVALASSPSLTPELARALYDDGRVKPRRALASNALTPPDLVAQMISDADGGVQAEALSRQDTPEHWKELMAKARAGALDGGPRLLANEIETLLMAGPWTGWWVTQQYEISDATREDLLGRTEPSYLSGLATRHGARWQWSEPCIERILDAGLGRTLIGNPFISPQRWCDILSRKIELFDAVLEASTHVDAFIWLLVQSEHLELRTRLAKSVLSPSWALVELSRDPLVVIRQHIASHPAASDEILARLALDNEASVRILVAICPRTPIRSLVTLGADRVTRIRQRVAANPNTPADVLMRLSADGEMAVRIVVARHPALPRSALEVLARDENQDVQRQANAVLQGDVRYIAWTPAC